jgi:hypothetical protein
MAFAQRCNARTSRRDGLPVDFGLILTISGGSSPAGEASVTRT